MNEGLCGADYVERSALAAREMMDKIKRLQAEVRWARNELCYQCGKYKEAHNGACDGCRFRSGGEWEMDLDKK